MQGYFYIIIIAIILIGLVWLKSPIGKGYIGELKVRIKLGRTKEGKQYIINNYMLEYEGKSSQIDHIIIKPNGVFVIETKNYSGLIFGNENQLNWTQVLAYGKVKHKLYNPLKQNATHIYRLKKILDDDSINIESIVVFVRNNTKHIVADNVIPLFRLKRFLKQQLGEELSFDRMREIYNKLIGSKQICNVSKREHIENIHTMKENLNNNICPRCGGALVKRNGKYGEFYGCENYPKCKFIKK